MLAAGVGIAYLGEDGRVEVLCEMEAHQRETVRMNDAGVDPLGRFWAGSMAYEGSPGAGSLYRVDLDGAVTKVLSGLAVPNGMGWSLDGLTMYHTDSGVRTIFAYGFDPASGEMGAGKPLVTLDGAPGAAPDGLTIDEEGCLWTAIWDGGRVQRYDPAGRLLEEVLVPVARPTSCCFAGHDLDLLVVTTARQGLDASGLSGKPGAGRLFASRPGATRPTGPALSRPREPVSR